MAIQERKDGLQFGDGVFDVHDGRLVGLDHGQWTRRCALMAALGAAGSRD